MKKSTVIGISVLLTIIIMSFFYFTTIEIEGGITRSVLNMSFYSLLIFVVLKLNPNKSINKIKYNKTYTLIALTSVTIGTVLLNTLLTLLLFLNITGKIPHPDKISIDYNYLSLIAIVLIPILEELFFRKSLIDYLGQSLQPFSILFISSIMFSLAHFFTESGLVMPLIVGFLLGHIYLKYQKILFTILVHLINNIVLFLYSDKIYVIYYDLVISEKTHVLYAILCVSLILISIYFILTKKSRNVIS